MCLLRKFESLVDGNLAQRADQFQQGDGAERIRKCYQESGSCTHHQNAGLDHYLEWLRITRDVMHYPQVEGSGCGISTKTRAAEWKSGTWKSRETVFPWTFPIYQSTEMFPFENRWWNMSNTNLWILCAHLIRSEFVLWRAVRKPSG